MTIDFGSTIDFIVHFSIVNMHLMTTLETCNHREFKSFYREYKKKINLTQCLNVCFRWHNLVLKGKWIGCQPESINHSFVQPTDPHSTCISALDFYLKLERRLEDRNLVARDITSLCRRDPCQVYYCLIEGSASEQGRYNISGVRSKLCMKYFFKLKQCFTLIIQMPLDVQKFWDLL